MKHMALSTSYEQYNSYVPCLHSDSKIKTTINRTKFSLNK